MVSAAALSDVKVFFLHKLTVSSGSHAAAFFEALGKVALGGEAGEPGDVGNTVVGARQKLLAHFDSALIQIVDGGHPVAFCERVDKVVFIQVGHLGQPVQGDVVLVVGIYVALNPGALPVGGLGNHDLESGVGDPLQADGKDVEHILADLLVSGLFLLQLRQHGTKIEQKVVFLLHAVKGHVFLIVAKGEA